MKTKKKMEFQEGKFSPSSFIRVYIGMYPSFCLISHSTQMIAYTNAHDTKFFFFSFCSKLWCSARRFTDETKKKADLFFIFFSLHDGECSVCAEQKSNWKIFIKSHLSIKSKSLQHTHIQRKYILTAFN